MNLTGIRLLGRLCGLFFALILLLSLPRGATAQANDPLSFYLYQRSIFQPVDYLTWCGDCVGVDYHSGTPWVTNPGSFYPFTDLAAMAPPVTVGGAPGWQGCIWDVDDWSEYHSNGLVLAAGASVSVNECRYAGGKGGPVGATDVWIQSSSSGLVVTESWVWDSGTVAATIVPTRDPTTHLWIYFDCFYSPPNTGGAGDGGTKVDIPDSNGGIGIPQRVTVTVANPTSQKATKTGGVIAWGTLPGINQGCLQNGYHLP